MVLVAGLEHPYDDISSPQAESAAAAQRYLKHEEYTFMMIVSQLSERLYLPLGGAYG